MREFLWYLCNAGVPSNAEVNVIKYSETCVFRQKYPHHNLTYLFVRGPFGEIHALLFSFKYKLSEI